MTASVVQTILILEPNSDNNHAADEDRAVTKSAQGQTRTLPINFIDLKETKNEDDRRRPYFRKSKSS